MSDKVFTEATNTAMEAIIVKFGALVSAMDENASGDVLVASAALIEELQTLQSTIKENEND